MKTNIRIAKPIYWIIIAAAVALVTVAGGMLLSPRVEAESQNAYKQTGKLTCQDTIVYKNTEYGFTLVLPEDWKDYTVIKDEWQGYEVQTGDVSETGPFISVRNPKWTSQNPYQDIPIYVFTPEQWEGIQKEQFHIGAAPIPPSELGRNSKYVFALPARYNFAYPTGWEEVDEILKNGGFRADEINEKNNN